MLRLLLVLILIPTLAQAATVNVPLTYSVDQTAVLPGPYSATTDRSWRTFDPDDTGPLPSAPHLMAVEVYANGQKVAVIVDDPGNRTTPHIAVDSTNNPKPKITLREVWLQQPWLASTAYAVGDKLSVFLRAVIGAGPETWPSFPNTTGWWECTRAGTSGVTEPVWDSKRTQLTNGYREGLENNRVYPDSAAVDNGNSTTVNIPVRDPTFELVAGDNVTITGTTNYDGTYTLPAQTFGDANNIEINAVFVAETFGNSAEMHLTAAEVVDNLDGTVTFPFPAHGFVAGDNITIYYTVNYDGAYTLPTQTNGDADHLVVTATYVAEVIGVNVNAYPTTGNVVDNDNATTVNIPAVAHDYVAGDVIDITGTTNYDGTYTLPAQTFGDANNIEINAVFINETLNAGSRSFRRINDSGLSGAEWQYITGDPVVGRGSPTGRIIVRDNGSGQAMRSGVNFIIRSQ